MRFDEAMLARHGCVADIDGNVDILSADESLGSGERKRPALQRPSDGNQTRRHRSYGSPNPRLSSTNRLDSRLSIRIVLPKCDHSTSIISCSLSPLLSRTDVPCSRKCTEYRLWAAACICYVRPEPQQLRAGSVKTPQGDLLRTHFVRRTRP